MLALFRLIYQPVAALQNLGWVGSSSLTYGCEPLRIYVSANLLGIEFLPSRTRVAEVSTRRITWVSGLLEFWHLLCHFQPSTTLIEPILPIQISWHDRRRTERRRSTTIPSTTMYSTTWYQDKIQSPHYLKVTKAQRVVALNDTALPQYFHIAFVLP